jgi:hypothetical protein
MESSKPPPSSAIAYLKILLTGASDWGQALLCEQMNQTCKVSMPDPDSDSVAG